MYSLSANYLASHVDEVLELADSDEILVTLDSSDNLMILKESTWRSLQDIVHLFATSVNAERLQQSLQQVRAEYLVEAAVE
ncbi:type II toxin-antitoxin system Phd/YefM family antitoxin [Herbaspirillum rhizosphaerae]|uniref:Type II toxin-antitoxin system Phd/YefM family antitoxin n=1 Tax=Herbaspirillum rhizosphaerae TaxID=346179 RepID=A0ABW8Z5Z9_9BURK